VTTLTDTGGDAVERYLYGPYGKVTIYDGTWTNTRSSSSYDNTILYTGREYDPETGFYDFRHRRYSAEILCTTWAAAAVIFPMRWLTTSIQRVALPTGLGQCSSSSADARQALLRHKLPDHSAVHRHRLAGTSPGRSTDQWRSCTWRTC